MSEEIKFKAKVTSHAVTFYKPKGESHIIRLDQYLDVKWPKIWDGSLEITTSRAEIFNALETGLGVEVIIKV